MYVDKTIRKAISISKHCGTAESLININILIPFYGAKVATNELVSNTLVHIVQHGFYCILWVFRI